MTTYILKLREVPQDSEGRRDPFRYKQKSLNVQPLRSHERHILELPINFTPDSGKSGWVMGGDWGSMTLVEIMKSQVEHNIPYIQKLIGTNSKRAEGSEVTYEFALRGWRSFGDDGRYGDILTCRLALDATRTAGRWEDIELREKRRDKGAILGIGVSDTSINQPDQADTAKARDSETSIFPAKGTAAAVSSGDTASGSGGDSAARDGGSRLFLPAGKKRNRTGGGASAAAARSPSP